MTIEGEGLLVRIYIGESDHVDGRPAYDAIGPRLRERGTPGAAGKLLRERGIRGASGFRGSEGFGRSSRVHTTRILALSEDLPILIEAVDEADRIRAVLPELEQLVDGGLVTLERVEVVVYRSSR